MFPAFPVNDELNDIRRSLLCERFGDDAQSPGIAPFDKHRISGYENDRQAASGQQPGKLGAGLAIGKPYIDKCYVRFSGIIERDGHIWRDADDLVPAARNGLFQIHRDQKAVLYDQKTMLHY